MIIYEYDTAIRNGLVHQLSFKNPAVHELFIETLSWINLCEAKKNNNNNNSNCKYLIPLP